MEENHTFYMRRCIELASQGLTNVAPNPMVGSVIVHNGKIIGEGYHREYGKSHAEPNAVASIANHEILKESTLYVNLEPCSVYSHTPPCSKLIIEKKIPKVVFGSRDTNSVQEIKGIETLREAGIEVIEGILEAECRELNKRFFTFQEKKRPYIILKWAQSIDGFIGREKEQIQITKAEALRLSHKWRTQEQAIMVGTNTVETDNPQLNAREWYGKNPTRITYDKNNRLDQKLHFFDGSQPTIVFTSELQPVKNNLQYVKIPFSTSENTVSHALNELHNRNCISLIVEGGSKLLNTFYKAGLWDETRVFVGNKVLQNGIKAPALPSTPITTTQVGEDNLLVFRNL